MEEAGEAGPECEEAMVAASGFFGDKHAIMKGKETECQ